MMRSSAQFCPESLRGPTAVVGKRGKCVIHIVSDVRTDSARALRVSTSLGRVVMLSRCLEGASLFVGHERRDHCGYHLPDTAASSEQGWRAELHGYWNVSGAANQSTITFPKEQSQGRKERRETKGRRRDQLRREIRDPSPRPPPPSRIGLAHTAITILYSV